jgi:hypothetical protein
VARFCKSWLLREEEEEKCSDKLEKEEVSPRRKQAPTRSIVPPADSNDKICEQTSLSFSNGAAIQYVLSLFSHHHELFFSSSFSAAWKTHELRVFLHLLHVAPHAFVMLLCSKSRCNLCVSSSQALSSSFLAVSRKESIILPPSSLVHAEENENSVSSCMHALHCRLSLYRWDNSSTDCVSKHWSCCYHACSNRRSVQLDSYMIKWWCLFKLSSQLWNLQAAAVPVTQAPAARAEAAVLPGTHQLEIALSLAEWPNADK